MNDVEGIGFNVASAYTDKAVATTNTRLSNVSFFMDLISFGLDKRSQRYGPGEPGVHGMKREEVPLNCAQLLKTSALENCMRYQEGIRALAI